MTLVKPIYIVDTSTFIKLGGLPRDIFLPLWSGFQGLIVEGRLVTHSEVKKELSGRLDTKEDDLWLWFREMDERFRIARDPSPFQIQKIQEIFDKYPQFIDYESDKPQADPFLISYAMELMEGNQQLITGIKYDYYLVTEERSGSERKNLKNPPEITRIPDYCKVYGIKCIDLWGLIRLEAWRLSLTE